jgi:hypothetical protein
MHTILHAHKAEDEFQMDEVNTKLKGIFFVCMCVCICMCVSLCVFAHPCAYVVVQWRIYCPFLIYYLFIIIIIIK